MKKERESSKLCYISGVNIIEYVNNMIDDIIVKLQKTRLEKGISLYRLAQMTGLAHTTIMRIENYSMQPSLEALMRMALALDVDLDLHNQKDNEEVSKSDMQSQLANDEKVNTAIHLCTDYYYITKIDRDLISDSKNPAIELNQHFLKLSQEIYLSFVSQFDSSKYIEEIEDNLQHYLICISKYNIDGNVRKRISELSHNLTLALREYYIGQHTSAYELFAEAMQKINISSLYCSLLPNQKLYRARAVNKTHEPLDKEDFFHIPFEKRTQVSSQRYSFPGLPCLYMGTSAEVCLKELGYQDNPVTVAELQVVPSMKYQILDMTSIFNKSADLMNEEEQRNFLELLPLIFVCSTKISQDDDNRVFFRPDYIIPQLLLEYILDKTVWRENPIIGIQYYSVQEDFYSKWLEGDIQGLEKMKNIVIPVRTNANKGHCKELTTLFRVNCVLKSD